MPRPLRELIVWGGTGNFRVLCELLREHYRVIGFFDNNTELPGYRGIPHLGNSEAFTDWLARRPETDRPAFIVSIGPGHGETRLRIHDELSRYGLEPIRAVHRTAFVAENAELGEGAQVYAQAAVCVEARLGRGCIVNTAASVDHECVLEDGVTIGPGARLAGLVHVGRYADIYTGAVVLPRVTIGERAVVGAGAVVLRDVPAGATVVGNPARIIR